MKIESETLCPICGRPLGQDNIDRHHLVPKSKGGKIQEFVHRICHRKIHSSFTEKELKKKFNTWEALRSTEELQDFIVWVKSKPIDFYKSSKMSNDQKRTR